MSCLRAQAGFQCTFFRLPVKIQLLRPFSVEQPSSICPFSLLGCHRLKTSQNTPFRLGLPPVDTGVPNSLLMLRNSLSDFVFEHQSGCCATEPGYAGDIGAIEIWLIDWKALATWAHNFWAVNKILVKLSPFVNLCIHFQLPGVSFLETRPTTEGACTPSGFLKGTINRLDQLASMESSQAQELMQIGIRWGFESWQRANRSGACVSVFS